jgi:type II secretory pathway component PulK
MRPDLPSPSRRGSALILVLWCLLLLGMAVFGVVELVELSVEHTSHVELASQARALAMSGVALGLVNNLTKDDPVLSQKTPDGKFAVTFGSEGARLNLNYVLLANHREILVNLFISWGLKIDQADRVADCLYDWVTPGDLKSLNGAKANDYAKAGLPQRPSNQPFVTLDEASLVLGMEMVEKVRPNWRDSFTLWSAGPLNINEAPPELIAAVFSLRPSRVKFLTDARNGRDGIAGTSDDVPITSLTTFQQELGLSDLAFKPLNSQVALADQTRRIESIGQAGGVQAMISVVTRLGTAPIQYLLWSEQ